MNSNPDTITLNKGFLIFLEGIDAAGKDTQIDILTEQLTLRGVDVVRTREPGGTPLGLKIREMLLNREINFSARVETLLFNADRANNVDTVYKPFLEQNKFIIGGRSHASTIAYQAFGRHEELTKVIATCEYALKGLSPDHIFILDITAEESKRRLEASGSRLDAFEKEGIKFYEDVRSGYLWSAKHYPELVTVIDGHRDVQVIAADIWDRILALILNKNNKDKH